MIRQEVLHKVAYIEDALEEQRLEEEAAELGVDVAELEAQQASRFTCIRWLK